MAELGIAASILQIATFGLKLYHELYKYADSNRSAGQRLKDIAQDVKFTSHIVRELRSVFDESRDIISKDAEKTAREVLDECQGIFDRMKEALDKCTGRRARWTFPFREETFELLRTNLDRLKSTLQLLMQVLTHAQQLSSSKQSREEVLAQRKKIELLIKINRDAEKKYADLLKATKGKAKKDYKTLPKAYKVGAHSIEPMTPPGSSAASISGPTQDKSLSLDDLDDSTFTSASNGIGAYVAMPNVDQDDTAAHSESSDSVATRDESEKASEKLADLEQCITCIESLLEQVTTIKDSIKYGSELGEMKTLHSIYLDSRTFLDYYLLEDASPFQNEVGRTGQRSSSRIHLVEAEPTPGLYRNRRQNHRPVPKVMIHNSIDADERKDERTRPLTYHLASRHQYTPPSSLPHAPDVPLACSVSERDDHISRATIRERRTEMLRLESEKRRYNHWERRGDEHEERDEAQIREREIMMRIMSQAKNNLESQRKESMSRQYKPESPRFSGSLTRPKEDWESLSNSVNDPQHSISVINYSRGDSDASDDIEHSASGSEYESWPDDHDDPRRGTAISLGRIIRKSKGGEVAEYQRYHGVGEIESHDASQTKENLKPDDGDVNSLLRKWTTFGNADSDGLLFFAS